MPKFHQVLDIDIDPTKYTITEDKKAYYKANPTIEIHDRDFQAVRQAVKKALKLIKELPKSIVIDPRITQDSEKAFKNGMTPIQYYLTEVIKNISDHRKQGVNNLSLRITIASKPNGHVWLKVKDRGHGFKEKASSIPFFSEPAKTNKAEQKRQFGGDGIGLTYSQKVFQQDIRKKNRRDGGAALSIKLTTTPVPEFMDPPQALLDALKAINEWRPGNPSLKLCERLENLLAPERESPRSFIDEISTQELQELLISAEHYIGKKILTHKKRNQTPDQIKTLNKLEKINELILSYIAPPEAQKDIHRKPKPKAT